MAFTFIFNITVIHGIAQYNTNFLNYHETGRCISTSFEFAAGSNGFDTQMANKLIWGGNINQGDKDKSATYLKAKNNFGATLNYDVSAFIKGKKNFDFLIGIGNQEVLNSTYSRDFYELMFYGNSGFRGRTADLSYSNINALRFQEIKFGAIMHKVDSIARIGISISVLKGEQLFYIKTNANSGLYTSADGTELIFNSNFDMALSDTTNRGIKGFNGIGASADIFFETPYKSKNGLNCVLTVNANNLGFIHWWNNSVQYNSDSTLHFTGYNITNINDLKDSTLNRINSDTLLQNLANARTENFNVNIPTNLVMINKIHFNPKLSVSLGFRYIFNANYRPYAFIEPEYRFKKHYTYTFHIGYGGYAKLNVGMAIAINTKDWFIKLGSNSLQGYFFRNTAYSQGVFISLAKKLK